MIDYGLVFITGLLASLHCVGMCGPIVLAYSTFGGAGNRAGMFTLHAAYNGGRILSYTLMGAVVGLAGTALGSLKVTGEYVSIIGGAAMILFGFGMLGLVFYPGQNTSGGPSGIIRKFYGALLKKNTMGSKISLGFLTPLLPCGMLYAMFIKAMAAGTAARGAITMAVFGIGMAPSLILIGSLSSVLSTRMRRGAEQLAAVTIILMGVILIMRGLHVPYLAWLTGAGHGDSESCILHHQ